MSNKEKDKSNQTVNGGCGLCAFIAAFLSYSLNHSFWWAVLHFFLSWIYIVYALFFRLRDIKDWWNAIN